ncbi:RNA editing complex MP57, putative [Babesia caballi]|uniref:RNA editing complex MP57, putative n=1 Tax=Babesia caballi TaxID=5871 RepID=A0AAV4M638_BABCB|nr:RNA editing complex MP57, putative [Babesia caballi]
MLPRLVALDLVTAAPLIDVEAFSLQQKGRPRRGGRRLDSRAGTITKGVAVLLYAQCTILLKDARAACKRAVGTKEAAPVRAALPRTKTRGRQVAFAETEEQESPLWGGVGRQVLKDQKIRLECLDSRVKTPNAHDGFAYNKIIMGVGIYSQYEFDEENNLRKQLTHVVRWGGPRELDIAGGAVALEGAVAGKGGPLGLCDGELSSADAVVKPAAPIKGYLYDLEDEGECGSANPQLRRIKRAALEVFDHCIIVDAERHANKRRHVRGNCAVTRNIVGHVLHRLRPGWSANLLETYTYNYVEEALARERETKYKAFFVKCIERKPPKHGRDGRKQTTRISTKPTSNAALTAVAVKKPYSLRSAKTQTEGGDLNGDVYSKLKIFCVEKHAGERCSLTAALAGDKPSREEVPAQVREGLAVAGVELGVQLGLERRARVQHVRHHVAVEEVAGALEVVGSQPEEDENLHLVEEGEVRNEVDQEVGLELEEQKVDGPVEQVVRVEAAVGAGVVADDAAVAEHPVEEMCKGRESGVQNADGQVHDPVHGRGEQGNRHF